jgi:hypothetical protein
MAGAKEGGAMASTAEKIVEVYALGVPPSDIAREMGLSREAVTLVLRMNSAEFRAQEAKATSTDVWTAEEREGLFLREMKDIALNRDVKPRERLDALRYLHEEMIGRNDIKTRGVERATNLAIAALTAAYKDKQLEIKRRLLNEQDDKIVDVS